LSPDVCRRTAEAFGDVLYNLYGSTEVAAAAVATPQDLRAAPGTVGRPPVGCRLACYDEDRRKITEPGRVGVVCPPAYSFRQPWRTSYRWRPKTSLRLRSWSPGPTGQ
jgi:acyl-coenzyme A synthetase/AMP-(fatty) acid ligase